jgi:hypothetical protein
MPQIEMRQQRQLSDLEVPLSGRAGRVDLFMLRLPAPRLLIGNIA